MALQAYEIHEPWPDSEVVGAVLVCTTSGVPVPTARFDSVDSAHAFSEWCRRHHGDPRILEQWKIAGLREQWDAEQQHRAEAEQGPEGGAL